jgi:hypothetical protein
MPPEGSITMTNAFGSLSDSARLWIYAANRNLSSMEQRALQSHLDHFLDDWTSHGQSVLGGYMICHDRFVIVAAEIPSEDISGCGIDKSVHILEDAAEVMGFQWLPGLDVIYVASDGEVCSAPRTEFRALADAGMVTSATVVFDLTAGSVGELRTGGFRKPAGSSWHSAAFELTDPAPEAPWQASRT